MTVFCQKYELNSAILHVFRKMCASSAKSTAVTGHEVNSNLTWSRVSIKACFHGNVLKIFFILEFSGLFYCSVIKIHFADCLFSSSLSGTVSCTSCCQLLCVSEIYITTLSITCQDLFRIILLNVYSVLFFATAKNILSPFSPFVNNFSHLFYLAPLLYSRPF